VSDFAAKAGGLGKITPRDLRFGIAKAVRADSSKGQGLAHWWGYAATCIAGAIAHREAHPTHEREAKAVKEKRKESKLLQSCPSDVDANAYLACYRLCAHLHWENDREIHAANFARVAMKSYPRALHLLGAAVDAYGTELLDPRHAPAKVNSQAVWYRITQHLDNLLGQERRAAKQAQANAKPPEQPQKAVEAPKPTQAPSQDPEAPKIASQTPPKEPMNTEARSIFDILATMPTGLIGSPEDSLLAPPKSKPEPEAKNAAPGGKNASPPQLPLYVGLPGSEADPESAPDSESIGDTEELLRAALEAKKAAAKADLAYAARLAAKAARAQAAAPGAPPAPVENAPAAAPRPAPKPAAPMVPPGYPVPKTKAEREAAEARARMLLPGFWRPCPEAIAKLPGILAFACTVAAHGQTPLLLYPNCMEAEVKAIFAAHGGSRKATQEAATELRRHAHILDVYRDDGCHANPCDIAGLQNAA